MFEPSLQVYTLWEHENGYTDSLGTQQADNKFDTGRASAGFKVSHAFPTEAGSVAPYLGLYGDYYFTMNSSSVVVPGAAAGVPLIHGSAGRVTGGFTTTFQSGTQFTVGGEFSGIGNSTQIWMVTVRGSVPF